MAEKKKMSVAEILAAARRKDGKQEEGAPPADQPAAGGQPATPESSAAEAQSSPPSEPESPPAEQAPAAPVSPPKPAAGGRPSVAEILAAARAQKAGGSTPAAEKEKPVPKPIAEKPAKPVAEKPVKPPVPEKQEAGEKKETEPAKVPPRDTARILAAARQGAKPGPVSKSELGAKTSPAARAEAKPGKIAVPPMPQRPASLQPKPKQDPAAASEERRWFLGVLFGSFLAVGFTTLAATAGLWSLGLARFMFPNILTEPPSRFKVGFKNDFPPGQVDERFKAQFGVWIVNTEYNGRPQIFALRTVCTHLGCTPNWLEGEQKFKCPCHGSGFYKDGINFEGPAPRPLERYAITIADDGQLEVDKSKLFFEEKGEWSDPSSFVPA